MVLLAHYPPYRRDLHRRGWTESNRDFRFAEPLISIFSNRPLDRKLERLVRAEKAHIQQVLQTHGGVMALKDVTAAVCKAGFKSKDKALARSVGVAMRGMRDVAKVGRGVFRAK